MYNKNKRCFKFYPVLHEKKLQIWFGATIKDYGVNRKCPGQIYFYRLFPP